MCSIPRHATKRQLFEAHNERKYLKTTIDDRYQVYSNKSAACTTLVDVIVNKKTIVNTGAVIIMSLGLL